MRRVNKRNTNKKRGFVLVYAVMILCVTVMSVSNTPANRGYMPFYAYASAEEGVLIPEETGTEAESVGETETELPAADEGTDPGNDNAETPVAETEVPSEEALIEAALNEASLNEEPLNEEMPKGETPDPEIANENEPIPEVVAAENTEEPEEIEPTEEITEEPTGEIAEETTEETNETAGTETEETTGEEVTEPEEPEEVPEEEKEETTEENSGETGEEVTEPEEPETPEEETEEVLEENPEETGEKVTEPEEIPEEKTEETTEENAGETGETEVETVDPETEKPAEETAEPDGETGTQPEMTEEAEPEVSPAPETEEPAPAPASRPMMMLAAPPAPTPTPAPEYLSDAELATQSIQAAINAALETAGTTERATIQIKAGNYEADIDIKLEKRPANFILELVADDAGADYLKGVGSVNFAGNIHIENVDVLLAGIYLALDKKISITDSHTQFFGTAQDDTVNVDLKYKGSVDVHTGAGDDEININVATDAGSLAISAGAGEDTVEINKGGSNGNGEFRNDNTATVDTGAGADTVTIDVGVADTYQKVVIENKNTKETGSNAVRFTGTLDNKSRSKGAAASGNENELTFRNAQGNTFTVKNMSPKAVHYTDALKNKPSVTLDAGNLKSVGGVYTFTGTAEPFTDYVLKIDPDTLAALAVKGGGLLSRLVLDARQFSSFASYDTVKVHHVKAPGMNIGIYGNEIEIDGTVYGSNINIEASDGTNQKRSTDGGTIGSAVGDFFASLQNVSHSARVTVTEDAMIAAREDLNISASVSQKLGLTALGVLNNSLGAVINGLGVVDVKVGKATVDIAGKLRAGYDAETDQYGAGSIRIDAKVLAPLAQSVDREVSSTSESGPVGQTDSVVPLSVFVAVEDAEINIRRGAELIAHDSVVAHARSAVTSDTRASTQSYLPMVLNTAILVNDAHVKVDGASITGMQGNVNLAAKGYLRSDILASKGSSDQSVSGGFFGISVGVQDVTADLAEGTEIVAGGDVRVASRADADVRSAAVAAYATSSAKKKTNTTSNDISIILGKIWASVDDKLKLTDKLTSKALDVIVGLFTSESRTVKVSGSSTVEGYGTASVKKTKANVGSTVTLNVLPKNGRDVETVRYRYLEPGASEYKYADVDLAKAKKSDTEYEFEMPDSDIVVFVTYQSAPGKTYPENGGNNDPFAHGNNGEIEMTDLSGIVDSATEAATEDTETAGSNGIATENSLSEDALPVTFGPFTEASHGAILTAADDGTGKPLSKLDAGSSVELTVNPAKGYALKKDTLAFQYTRQDGARERVYLEADSNGKYFLVIPEDARAGYAITVTAQFEISGEEPRKQTASAQAVGALATGVVENRNDTIIDLGTGKIVAGGKAEFLADGSTVNDVYADASRLTKSATEAAKSAAVAEEKARYYTTYAEGGSFAVKVKDVKGGTVESELTDGVIAFTATSADAETTPTCAVFYTDDLGESQTLILERGEDGKFLLNLKDLHVKGGTNVEVGFDFPDSTDTSSTAASFVEDCDHSVQLTAKGYGKIEQQKYGYDGKYSLNFNPGLGYKVKSITVGYKDLTGKLRTIPVTVVADKMNYVLSVNDLPDGCQPGQAITVTAEFDAYNRTLEVPKAEDVANGKLTVDKTEAKAGDTVTGDITPEDGYKAREVAYVYTDENGLTQVEYADIKDGKYTFTMPAMKFGPAYKVEIKTTFVKKDVEIIVDGTGFKAAQSRADRKEATALIADDPNTKLTDVVIKAYDASGAELNGVTVEYKDGKLTIPDNDRIASVRVSANTDLKALRVNAMPLDEKQGSVTVSAKRVDPGESVNVTFDLEKGYIVKEGSVKAVIMGGIEMTVKATRSEDGSYRIAFPEDCGGGAVEIHFEVTEGTEAKNTAGLYVGTGIAVAVTGGDNKVHIRSGSVTTGKDFTVQALTGSSVSGAVAKSGYSEAKVGIGGAIAVNIGGYTTDALIYKPAVITVNGGAVKIKAGTKVAFTTVGDSSVKTDKANTGVGTGIAVAVNSSDAYAAVQDQTTMAIGRAVTGIDITADQKLTDTVTAKAGSAGNTAVTPSVAVDIFASDTVAILGAILGDDIDISRDSGATLGLAAINAANKAIHTLTADASAAGKGVGLGGAFGIAVLTDQVKAALEKSLKANGIYVGSDAQSTVKMTINAGTEGGAGGSKKQDGSQGSADTKADQLTKNAAALSSGKNSNTGALKIGDKLNGRQKAQTGEGSVAGAAALALNIFENSSVAELGNGTYEAHGLADYVEDPIKTPVIKKDLNGTIRVKSINRTEAQIKANASATKSTYGVGVAVGVNIVDLTNTAMITDAGIIADKLDVQAVQPTVKIAEVTTSSAPNLIKETVTGAVKVAVTRIMDGLGIHKILKSDVIETLVSDLAGEFANSFMAESGVDKIFTVTSIEDQVKKNYEELKGNLADEVLAMFRLVLLDQLGEEKGGKAYTAIRNDLKKQIDAASNGFNLNLDSDEIRGYRNDILAGLVTFVAEGIVTGEANTETLTKPLFDSIYKMFSQVYAAKDFTENIRKALTGYDPSLSGIVGSVLNAFKERFPDMVSDCVVTMAKPVELPKLLKYLNSGMKETLQKNIQNALAKASVKVAESQIRNLDEKYDLLLKAENVAEMNVFKTEAISGAGATDLGVAGSVALLVLNENTYAGFGNTDPMAVEVGGDMTVNAANTHRITTVASASADGSGDANTNDEASAGANDAGSGKTGELKLEGDYDYITIAGGPGYTVEVEPGTSKAKILVDDGYTVPFTVPYTYTDKDGNEKQSAIMIGEGNTFTLPARKSEMPEDGVITIKPVMTEVLKTVADPLISGSDPTSGAEAAVRLPDRDGDDVSKARPGETVEISTAKVAGKHVGKVSYTYEFVNGSGVTETKTETVEATAYTNDEEIVYSFRMPDGNITAINVYYEDGADTTGTTNSKGESVGVGASFAMVYGNTTTEALLENENITVGGDLSVTANLNSKLKTASVAGTDPMALKKQEKVTGISVDASVALNLLDSSAKTVFVVGDTASVTGNMTADAEETTINVTQASGFAVGKATAVGAAAAINVGENDAETTVSGGLLKVGKETSIKSGEHSEDTIRATATALGADIQRMLNKYSDKLEATQKNINGLLDGSIFKTGADKNKAKQNGNNATAGIINGKLNAKAKDGQASANNNNSVSTNILITQNASTSGSTDADKAAASAAGQTNGAAGLPEGASVTGGNVKESKFQVAAAAAVNVAEHNAKTRTDIRLIHENDVLIASSAITNTRTLGTAAAISGAVGANSISAGVAISVNNSGADTELNGNVTGETGNVTVSSEISQNLTKSYAGRLAVQALSGAVSGKDSSASIAGAVTVLVSEAKAQTRINAETVNGDHVSIVANDKSRLASRAGGLSLSKGATVGVGAAFSSVFSNDTVKTEIADGTEINAKSAEIAARKIEVTRADYHSGLDMRTVVTDSSKLTPEQRKNAETGIIDLHKATGDKNYSLDINLSTDKLLSVMDLANFLSGVNYYNEAIAGSIVTGQSSANVAGSFAVTYTDNTVRTLIGKGVKINTAANAAVEAINDNSYRTIAGAVSAGASKAGVGLTLGYLQNDDTVEAILGQTAEVNAGEDYLQSVSRKVDAGVFTAAASVGTGKAVANVGGAINVILLEGSAKNTVDSDAKVNALGALKQETVSDLDLLLVSADAQVTGGKVAAGGTVAVVVNNSKTTGDIRTGAKLNSVADLELIAAEKAQLISAIASVSAAKGTVGAAGAVNVLVSSSENAVNIGENVSAESEKGNLIIAADSDTWLLNAGLAAAGSTGVAVGGTVAAEVLSRKALVNVASNAHLQAGENLEVRSAIKDFNIMAQLSGSLSTGTAGVSGTIPVIISGNTGRIDIGQGAELVSGKAMDINAHYSARIYGVAGSLAASTGTAAVGATVQTVVLKNTIETLLRKDSRLTAGSGVSSQDRKGLYIGADADETAVFVAIGGAGAGTAAVSGAVNTLVITDTVRTNVESSVIRQTAADQLTVEAAGNTHAVNVSGGLGIAGTAAVGASVVTQVLDKTVETIVSNSKLSSKGDMALQTRAEDDLELIAVSAGIAGTAAVETGAVVNIYENNVNTAVSGSELLTENSLSVTADKAVNADTTAVAVAGSGTAAVSPVAAVTVLGGKTNVALDQNNISVNNGAMTARAKTVAVADPTVAGAGLAGAVSVSGAVSVLVSREETSATVLTGQSDVIRAAEITVDASDRFTSEGISGVLAGSGTAAVAVNALVTVLKNTVRSEIAAPAGRNDSIQSTNGNINLTAKSVRDVTNIGSTLGVAGTAGVSVAVMVLTSGGKITQDAADALANGGSGSATTFDSNAFMKDAFARGGNKYTAGYEANAQTVTGEALAGDGAKAADMKLGTQVSGKGSFDATNGYRDTDANYEKGSVESRNFNSRSTDLENAAKLGSVSETAREDSVAAILNAGVIAGKDINVKAESTTQADSVTAALSAGGVAGVGFGVNVAVLNSGVQAIAEKNAVLKAGGDINLYAYSGSEEIRDSSDTGSITGQLNSLLYNSELNRSGRSVRVISAAASAGFTGVAVPVAVLRMNNATSAKMLAKAESAKTVNVESVTDYPLAMAATVALSAGIVGIGGSVAVATAEGTSEAIYDLSNADWKASGININISNASRIDATALAMAGGGGAVTVNAGIAVAANRMKNAATLAGGKISGAGNITINSTADTTAHTYVLTMGAGLVTGSLSGAVSIVSPENISRIATGTELDGVSVLTIKADSTSSSKAKALTAGIGFESINGAILLSFNDSVNKALLDRVNVKNATILRINSSLNATADTDSTATSAGAYAVGLNVSYTDMHAENAALVDLDMSTIRAEQLDLKSILTSTATASSVVAALSGLSAGFNTAIVDARGSNMALIRTLSPATSQVSINRMTIAAEGTSKANALMRSRNLSLVDAGASFALALQRTEQTSGVNAGNSNLKDVRQLDITSVLNKNVTDAVLAKIISNDSAIMKLNASVAEAYGRSVNRAMLSAFTVQADGAAVNVTASGKSGAKANVTNGTNAAIAATVFQNLAYAQDVIEAKVTGLNQLTASSLNVGVDYGFAAESILQPTVGSVSLASVSSNKATAKVSSQALASVKDNRLIQLATGALNITTNGGISAKSEVQISSGKVTVSGVRLAANIAKSDITANVGAELANNYYVQAATDSTVSSILKELTSSATTYGYNSKAKVSFINGDLHKADANMHAVNTATLSNSNLQSGSLTVRAENGKATSTATTLNDTSSASVNFASAGNMKALAGINSGATVKIAGMNVKTGNVNISASADVTSGAIGTSPKSISAVAYGGSYMTSTIGSETARQTVEVLLSGSQIAADGDFNVKVKNTGGISSELRNKKVTNLSLAQLSNGDISTKSYYVTDIELTDATTVSANNITIDLYDAERAESVANSGKSLSGLDLSSIYGNNRVSVIDVIHLGKQTALDAKRMLKITADNAATVTTETSSSAKSILASSNTVQATSTLSRTLSLNMDEGSILFADYGDMLIDLRSGLNDVVNSVTYAEAVGAFTGFSKASATANITSTADVMLNRAILRNDFGTMTIRTAAGGDGNTSASAQGGGLVGKPTASAYVLLTGRSRIQAIGSEITAKYLNLLADVPKADLLATSSGKASGLGAYVNSWGTVDLAVDSIIDLDQSVLTGHEEMVLLSGANPDGNLKANSGGRTSGAYASGESAAKVDGHVIGTLKVNNSHLKGANIVIAREALDQSKVIRDASMKKKGLFGSPSKNRKGTVTTENGSENITFNRSKITLGGGAAGIAVEVYNENGATLTRSYGLSGRRGGRLLADGKVQITDLASFDAGALTVMDGSRVTDMHGTEILHPDYVPSFTVTNLSDRDIILGKVLESSGFLPEHMRILGAKNYSQKRDTNKSSLKLDVITTQGKDVYLGDIIDMPSTVASFIWKGARGSLYTINGSEGEILNFMKYGDGFTKEGGTAPKLFVKQLVTQNGKNLGKAGTPVAALLFGDDSNGLLQLDNENIDLEITPAMEEIARGSSITELELRMSYMSYPSMIEILGKVQATGHCNIDLQQGVVYLHTKDPIQVYDVPDTIRYTDIAHTLAELYATYGKGLIETQYTGSNNGWYLNKAAGAVFLTTDAGKTTLGDVVLATYDAYYQGTDENGVAMYELPDGTVLWYDSQGKLVRMQLMQTMTDGSVQGVLYELGDISVSRDNAYMYNGYYHYSGKVEGVGTFKLGVPMRTFDNPFDEANYTLTLDPDITYVTDLRNVNSIFACDMLSQGLAQIAYRDDEGNYIYSNVFDRHENERNESEYTTVCKTYFGVTEQDAIRSLTSDDWKPVYVWFEKNNIPDLTRVMKTGEGDTIYYTMDSSLIRIDRDIYSADERSTADKYVFVLDSDEQGNNRTEMEFRRSGSGFTVYYQGQQVGQYDPNKADNRVAIPGGDLFTEVPYAIRMVNGEPVLYMMDMAADEYVSGSIKIEQDPETQKYVLYLMDPGSDLNAEGNNATITVRTAASASAKPVVLSLNDVHTERNVLNEYLHNEVNLAGEIAARIDNRAAAGANLSDLAYYKLGVTAPVVSRINSVGMNNFLAENVALGNDIYSNPWAGANADDRHFGNWNQLISDLYAASAPNGKVPYYWMDGSTKVYDTLVADLYANSYKGFSLQGNILGTYNYVQNGVSTPLTVTVDDSGKMTFFKDGTVVAERTVGADGTVYITANGVKVGSDRSYDIIDAEKQTLFTRVLLNNRKTANVIVQPESIVADTVSLTVTKANIVGETLMSDDEVHIRANEVTLVCDGIVDKDHQILTVGALDKDNDFLKMNVSAVGNVMLKSVARNNFVGSIRGTNLDLSFDGHVYGDSSCAIQAKNMTLTAKSIGTGSNALRIHVSGKVNVNGGENGKGRNNVWYTNLYRDPKYKPASDLRNDRRLEDLVPIYELNELENIFLTAVKVLFRNLDTTRIKNNRIREAVSLYEGTELVALKKLAEHNSTLNRLLTFIYVDDLAETEDGLLTGTSMLEDAIHGKAEAKEGETLYYIYFHNGEMTVGSGTVEEGLFTFAFEGSAEDYAGNNGYIPFVMADGATLETACEILSTYMEGLD